MIRHPSRMWRMNLCQKLRLDTPRSKTYGPHAWTTRGVGNIAAFSAFVVVAASALLGLQVLEFFGITLASFQVGGGLLLLMSSINMLHAEQAESRAKDVDEGASRAAAGASIAVVPLAIPLLTGPAAISTVVIYAEKSRHFG